MRKWVHMTGAGLLVVFLAASCASSDHLSSARQDRAATDTLYLAKRGWHTGILVSRSSIDTLFPDVLDHFPEATYLNFSWGDRKFFMADKGTWGLALRAALLPTQSVMHVDGLDRLPPWYVDSKTVVRVELPVEGFRSMMEYIRQSFARNKKQQLIPLRMNKPAMSHFYLSGITYWGTRTCNVWTARALKRGGLHIHPFFYLTAGQVIRRVRAER